MKLFHLTGGPRACQTASTQWGFYKLIALRGASAPCLSKVGDSADSPRLKEPASQRKTRTHPLWRGLRGRSFAETFDSALRS